MSDPESSSPDEREETSDKGGDSDPSSNEGFAPPDDEDRGGSAPTNAATPATRAPG